MSRTAILRSGDTLAPGLTLSLIACARRPAAPPAAVIFTRDIAPIAFVNCVPCHRQGKVASDAEARSHQAGRRQFAPAASAVRHLHDAVQRRTSARGACDENASELYAPSSRVALAGQNVGITQVGDRVWLVSFMECDLGYFDDATIRVEPIDNRFGARVLPMCSV